APATLKVTFPPAAGAALISATFNPARRQLLKAAEIPALPREIFAALVRFRKVVAAAYAQLEERRQEVNDLNVFPVADGDTGDNMAMTMRAVLTELDGMNGLPIDTIGRDQLVHAVARAALLGARGNSGVILSQIVRGAAEELASRPGELVDPVLVSAAFARAADVAYESVRDPAEGTMLSAVRAAARRVAHDLAHMDTQRLGPDATDAEQDELLAEVLERALDAAKEAVERGPEQLAVLREAGVVDAGAYGLTVILAGVVAALRGREETGLEHQAPPARALHQPEHESSEYRYCTNFAVTGVGLSASSFIAKLEQIGDSVLVVGDDATLRVHVHTDEPDSAAALFTDSGEVSRFDVADMREQVADRQARLGVEELGCSAVVVANGAGIVRMFRELGAEVVDGGATLNPSTYDLLAGIHAAPGAEVVVLPNSPNVILTAERAAELSEKPARVVPTRSQQAGLAALLALDGASGCEGNAAGLGEALAGVETAGVAPAARDDAQGRFRAGEAVGYAGEALVSWGDPEKVLGEVLAQVGAGAELITCIAGAGAPLESARIEAICPEGAEIELHDGGQAAWWWLVAAE
ncbi:MAG: DAK2 domain-containing protein, partial [Thermoleophilaceae bacterium]|nr:DAK2 domain-containing protein [Thermoleophilaceae bacterium]